MYNFKIDDPHFLPHTGCTVDLNLASGQCGVILGENGLGKTTLLKRLFSDFYKSSVLIEQKSLDYFYDRSLGKLRKMFISGAGQQIDSDFFLRSWVMFGLDDKEDRIQSALSGGEGQALKLCLGLALKAPLYFMDEPSQFLDTQAKITLATLIQEKLMAGHSILMVEHAVDWINFPTTCHQFIIKDRRLQEAPAWST